MDRIRLEQWYNEEIKLGAHPDDLEEQMINEAYTHYEGGELEQALAEIAAAMHKIKALSCPICHDKLREGWTDANGEPLPCLRCEKLLDQPEDPVEYDEGGDDD